MEIVFVRDGLTGSHQPTICKKENNTLFPILHFRKAKGARQFEFDAVVNFVVQQLEKTMQQ